MKYYFFWLFLIGSMTLLWAPVATAKDVSNLVSFIPEPSSAQHDKTTPMQEVCQYIHTHPNSPVNHMVMINETPVRIVSGIPATGYPTVFIFVSGWAGWPGNTPYRYNGNAAYYAYLYQQAGIIQDPCICYDHPDQTYTTATFGQKPDQDNLAAVLEKAVTAHPQAQVVLVGFSYGATTILNFISQQSHEKLAAIKAVILESPYINLERILAHAMSRFIGSWCSEPLAQWLTRWMPQYDQKAPTIIERAHAIPKHIPIMIGAIETDHVVAYKDSRDIAQILRNHNLSVEWYADSGTDRHSYMSRIAGYAHAVQNFLTQLRQIIST